MTIQTVIVLAIIPFVFHAWRRALFEVSRPSIPTARRITDGWLPCRVIDIEEN